MLESIRKYQWLMIAVFILLAAGFLFTMNEFSARPGSGGQKALIIHGDTYDVNDVDLHGDRALGLSRNLGEIAIIGQLGGDFRNPNPIEFFTNRLIIRKAARDLGIIPSEEQIIEAIRSNAAFQNPDTAEFDSQEYSKFTTDVLNGRFRSTKSDLLYPLVSDYLILMEIQGMIGSGLSTAPEIGRPLVDFDAQQVSGEVVTWSLDAFTASLQPSDEDLQAYWEEHKTRYLTDPRYTITYAINKPVYPEAPQPKDGEDAATIAAEQAEVQTKINRKVMNDMNQLEYLIRQTPGGEGFESEIEKAGLTIEKVEAVTEDNLPAAFKQRKLGNNRETGLDNIRKQIKGSLTGDEAIGQNFTTLARETVIYRIDDYIAPEPLPFEEAKEAALEDYKTAKGTDALIAKVKEEREALVQLVESGKSVADAAAERGLETKAFTDLTISTLGASDLQDSFSILDAAKSTEVGNWSDIIGAERLLGGQRAHLLFVTGRTAVESETRTADIEQQAERAANSMASVAFRSWLNEQRDSAKITSFYSDQN